MTPRKLGGGGSTGHGLTALLSVSMPGPCPKGPRQGASAFPGGGRTGPVQTQAQPTPAPGYCDLLEVPTRSQVTQCHRECKSWSLAPKAHEPQLPVPPQNGPTDGFFLFTSQSEG